MKDLSNNEFILTDQYVEPAKCEQALPPLPRGSKNPLKQQTSPRTGLLPKIRTQRLPFHDPDFNNQHTMHQFHSASMVHTLCTPSPTRLTFTSIPDAMEDSSPGRPKSIKSFIESFNSPGCGDPCISLPPDQRSRALWFLETVGSAASQMKGIYISPNIFLPRNFWKMTIVSPELVQAIEQRIKTMKRVLKYQNSFEKEFYHKGNSLQMQFSSRLVLLGTQSPPTPPPDGELPGSMGLGSPDTTRVNYGNSTSAVLKRVSSGSNKVNVIVRYASMASQLLEAVKREYSFGLETSFVDFVLETITPCFVDDIFDLHAIYMDHSLKQAAPEIGNLAS